MISVCGFKKAVVIDHNHAINSATSKAVEHATNIKLQQTPPPTLQNANQKTEAKGARVTELQ